MGCDIHLIAEVHKAGKWQLVPGPIVNCWGCGGTGRNMRDKNDTEMCRWCTREFESYVDEQGVTQTYRIRTFEGIGKMRDNWFSDRNYSVFAHLADVRNDGSIRPIAQVRGFPHDMSKEAQEWMDTYGGDHSETWLSLREVLAHSWDVPHVREGIVDLNEYRTFKEKGAPESWSGSVSVGLGGQVLSNPEMDAALLGKSCGFKHCVNPDHAVRHDRAFTRITWTARGEEECREFLDRMQMLMRATKALAADTRLIFNFDS